MVHQLKAAGVPITAVGIQEHVSLDWPSNEQLETAIRTLAAAGVKVNISELDVDVLPSPWHSNSADVGLKHAADAALNPYSNGLPETVQQKLAAR